MLAGVPMLFAKLCIKGPVFNVAVFYPSPWLFKRACTQVYCTGSAPIFFPYATLVPMRLIPSMPMLIQAFSVFERTPYHHIHTPEMLNKISVNVFICLPNGTIQIDFNTGILSMHTKQHALHKKILLMV